MSDKRSGKIVVVSHCIVNVHSLEDQLAMYSGLEEEVLEILIKKGVGIFQIPCPEVELAGIFRKPLPKESYDQPKIRKVYHSLAEREAQTLSWYIKKGYRIVAVIGAEGSPTCGINLVGRWKKGIAGKKEFPSDIEFISGIGVFMEEFKASLARLKILPEWIGIPGKSIRTLNSEAFIKALKRLDEVLK